jgi:hypothetical protein
MCVRGRSRMPFYNLVRGPGTIGILDVGIDHVLGFSPMAMITDYG